MREKDMNKEQFLCTRIDEATVSIVLLEDPSTPFIGDEMEAVELLTNMGLSFEDIQSLLA